MLKARINSPVMIVNDAMKAMFALGKASDQGGVPPTTKLLTTAINMKDSFHTKPRRVAQSPEPSSCP